MKKKAVFFDRDGSLTNTFVIDNKPYAPTRPEDLELLPETPEILNRLHDANHLIIVVSNQPDIALGKIDEPTRLAIEKKFVDLIEQKGVHIDEIFYCHHHPDSINPEYPKECGCRKPKPRMIIKAAEKFGIDLSKSWVIGDTDKDINAGKSAGCRTILIQRSYSGNCEPDFSVQNLSQCVDIVLKNT